MLFFCKNGQVFIRVCINYLTAFLYTDDTFMSPDQLNFKFCILKGNSLLNIILIHNAMHDIACLTSTKNATTLPHFGI